jgi:hypothetical protein
MSAEACWFCGGEATDAAADEVRLTAPHSIRHGPGNVSYEQACLKVPRCERCRLAHQRVIGWQDRGLILSVVVMLAVIGLAAAVVPGVWANLQSFIGLAVVALLLWGAARVGQVIGDKKGRSQLRAAGIQPPETNLDYPPVRQLIDQGYFQGVPKPV